MICIRSLSVFNGVVLRVLGVVWTPSRGHPEDTGGGSSERGEDFYLATREDTELGIREDFFMAMDIVRTAVRTNCLLDWRSAALPGRESGSARLRSPDIADSSLPLWGPARYAERRRPKLLLLPSKRSAVFSMLAPESSSNDSAVRAAREMGKVRAEAGGGWRLGRRVRRRFEGVKRAHTKPGASWRWTIIAQGSVRAASTRAAMRVSSK
jgi:hypothetical protein